MFRLTRAVTGGSSAVPVFRVVSEEPLPPMLLVSAEDRQFGVAGMNLPRPSGIGEFFFVPLGLSEAESAAVAGLEEAEETRLIQRAGYWRYGSGVGIMRLLEGREEPLRYLSIHDAAAATLDVSSLLTEDDNIYVHYGFGGYLFELQIGLDEGDYVVRAAVQVDSSNGLGGIPLWVTDWDGSILITTVSRAAFAPAIATLTHFPVPPSEPDGAYLFDLDRIPGGKIIQVESAGTRFTEGDASSLNPGEYGIEDRALLRVRSGATHGLRDRIEVVSINGWPHRAELAYLVFAVEPGAIYEQISYFGRVFGAAENPMQPQAGEFVQGDVYLYLFVDRLPYWNLQFLNPVYPVGQILGAV